MDSPARLRTHADLASTLALLSDSDLAELVASGTAAGSGIGGRAVLLEVDGVRVFVKRVPLTDTELRPHHVRSTANVFDLPVPCHYGIGAIGSPGFGAWRELAVHEMTTNWVRSGPFLCNSPTSAGPWPTGAAGVTDSKHCVRRPRT
ncbi:hypothetical protein [Streptomyces griseorubiginosus]|uniref:hypothetical protein n=1 Tax=Streptomyces griseorubiginosus TaxID=67304 RepID=UPI0036B439BA